VAARGRHLMHQPGRTLMRTPVVKRHTTPKSGFLVFFRRVGPGVVSLSQRVLTWFPCSGTDTLCLHQTLIEALSPWRWRVQRSMDAILCGLETSPCPHTVLCKVAAQRRALASSAQVRGRGSTPVLGATRAVCAEPERMSNQRPRDRGNSAYVLFCVL
jgi:hypothetical protein